MKMRRGSTGRSCSGVTPGEGVSYVSHRSQPHSECVNSWSRGARCLAPEPYREAFQRAFDAVYGRARVVLGDVTCGAILDRIIDDTRLRFPGFAQAKTGGTQNGFDVRAASRGVRTDELEIVARFVLLELLTVLGHLTGGILTPALHGELSSVPVAIAGLHRSYARRPLLQARGATR